MGEIYLTREGRNKLIEEIDRLQKRKPQIQDEIARAREHGDLRENAEYHAAKEALTNLMQRIAEIDSKLSRAKIIEELNIDPNKVFIGVTVTLKDEDGDEYEYSIVDVDVIITCALHLDEVDLTSLVTHVVDVNELCIDL